MILFMLALGTDSNRFLPAALELRSEIANVGMTWRKRIVSLSGGRDMDSQRKLVVCLSAQQLYSYLEELHKLHFILQRWQQQVTNFGLTAD